MHAGGRHRGGAPHQPMSRWRTGPHAAHAHCRRPPAHARDCATKATESAAAQVAA
eukprot:CAMPEP_0170288076 /NCGR_PEP_ID=MMETSP0116_2-20130129/44095_1 /TAXON_ID=400756 /ORGANISM="Durinskia baltica, Strain CSIRO CS-38" /LENGTH=54 /DNA_ID=CAMNT_0010539493 /DNA_START=57 /DNA_END=217 /DNA_ORIENTATION=+